MTAGGTMGTKWRRTNTKLNWSIIDLGSRSTATTAAVQKKFAVSSLVLHGQQWLRVRQEVAGKQFSPPIEHQPAGDESSRVGFTSAEHLAHYYASQQLQAGSVTQW